MLNGFDVPCLKCGEVTTINLNINGLDDSAAFSCAECNAEYGVDDVRTTINGWADVLKWIMSATKEDAK